MANRREKKQKIAVFRQNKYKVNQSSSSLRSKRV